MLLQRCADASGAWYRTLHVGMTRSTWAQPALCAKKCICACLYVFSVHHNLYLSRAITLQAAVA